MMGLFKQERQYSVATQDIMFKQECQYLRYNAATIRTFWKASIASYMVAREQHATKE